MGKITKSKKLESKSIKHDAKKSKIHKKPTKGKVTDDEDLGNMPVEEFFNGGFEGKDDKKMGKKHKNKNKNKNKNKKQIVEEDAESSSSSEDEAVDMEANMAALSEQDPEFYKFLKDNDKDLLDFTASNPLDAISGSDNDDNDQDADQHEEEDTSNKVDENKDEPAMEKAEEKIDLTLKLVLKWKKSLKEEPTLKLIRNVVTAFKVAVNLNKEENIAEYKYTVTDEKAFHELMFLCLKGLPQAIQKLAPYKMKKNVRILQTGKTVTKLSSILKSHAASLLTLLNDITNTETAALVLYSVDQLLPFFLSHRRLLKEMIKAIVEIWATTRDVETQIATFALLHSSSKEFKKSILELVLRATYSTFVKSCRKTNMRTMPLINFQKNSAAELFAIDEVLSYQVGFEYIRQLAIQLRNAMTTTTKKSYKVNSADAYKLVYNWQFCHSLDFWSRVLSFSCNSMKKNAASSPLSQLVYPLVQVTIGVIRLNPTPQYFPLRFYLIRSLIRLSQNTSVMVPVYPLLSEILNSTAFTKSPKKKENLEAFDFDHNIKCNQAYLNTRAYQEGLSEQFVDLISEYFVLYCKDISFPEFSTPAIIGLRRYMKASKNIKFNKQLSNVVEKLTKNSDYIDEQRSTADFSPIQREEVMNFLREVTWSKTPLGSYVTVQREVKEERARLMRESLEEEDRDKEEQKLKEMVVEDEIDEADEDDEDDEDVDMSD
ncbi:hypothetical protein Kpol_1072p49 [Vanderwaltozyma polyspora DSM 70294]|uniref:Nucleolar complex protein 2 n=1 Tax=Vanderwaltozyma polyspora (strain ATCC 22028 / DSM 70294 / BCRC 21397 / CBS 2163 / NBRC 10782 / NRRL Y-8283 / UCD 57-17) TaxID=436907 RepID=A7TKR7_VANPO|nr:uncharacterized protein Kpol_1072p49 [Vanderwaltozyma polyspora DSM 70294]EDO17179.1 hypothetical protein Kpol_1072p49 [Vanderwaltozyma polyspora DSM 70294]